MKRRTSKIAAPTPTSTSTSTTETAKLTQRLLKYEELPEYLKDNEFITDYYRCEWPLKDVILSVFSLHNETLNIWTHLVGFMIFLGLTVMSLTEKMSFEKVIAGFFGEVSDGWVTTKMMNNSNGSSAFFSDSYLKHVPTSPISALPNSSPPLPLWPWFVFLSGAMSCLVFSAISHLFSCHSRRFYYFFWRLDYTGISLMIISSFFAPIYYAFSDHPYYLLLYLSTITLLGILVVIILLAPALSTARFRSLRATIFLSMGFSGVIPATHALVLYWNDPLVLGALGFEIAMGVLYGVGAMFYVTRIPERWKPGAFDIVGHSHQIFHVFVVVAALAHSGATLIVMEWRRRLSG